MRGPRGAVADEVARFLAQARGTAATAARSAAEEVAADEVRVRNCEDDAARLRYELAEECDLARAAAAAKAEANQTDARVRLTALTAGAAPGAASAPWEAWTPTEATRGALPGLYRIGALDCGPAALVPLLDHAHLAITGDAGEAIGIVATLLLRALGGTVPGAIELTVYDPEQLGGSLAGFAALSPAKLAGFVGPGGLTGLLDTLVEEIRRIHETVLAGEFTSLRDLAASTGRRPEPWRVAVLLGDGSIDDGVDDLTDHQRAQLDRIARTGVACGVHLVTVGLPLEPAEHLNLRTATSTLTGALTITMDPPPPAELVTRTCRAIADRVAAGPEPSVFADLLPEKLWTESSATGLSAPIGEGADGRLVDILLGDAPPHALIGGPSGSGKTNFLYAWLGALCTRYSPDELELYLLDFKEGVSFARFARGRRDPSWLPHVRLVGVNVNSDREFGLALLRFLADELRRRAEAAKLHEATKLEELRTEDPGGRWPRIMAVIDEFQVLLSTRDAVCAEAVNLLEDLARRGRSQGIHLVLASQDVAGIEALWGRTALVGQFTLRIALPKARKMMADNNLAADVIPRYHAVVNPDSGALSANRIVRIPDAGGKQVWEALQQQLWGMRSVEEPEPRLFDGDHIPPLPAVTPVGAEGAPLAALGETIDVAGRPALLRMSRAPGRNLAVLGTRTGEACSILGAAALSLGRQHAPGTARFTVVCMEEDALNAAATVVGTLVAAGHAASLHTSDGVRELFADIAADLTGPHYLIVYAVDAAHAALAAKPGPTGLDHLRTILQSGPEKRTHVLGWWRGVSRLRDDLGGVGARLDAVGAWVALDVHGNELTVLSPQAGGPYWYPREHRALFFDRAHHRLPEIFIPYEVR